MVDDALRILDHLPLRRSEKEGEYINYLWSAYEHLTNADAPTSTFSLMAYHLIFILAVQYKALRMKALMPAEYTKFFTDYPARQDADRVRNAQSVFDLALANEKSLMHLFSLLGLSAEEVSRCKNLIDVRNNEFMHAAGYIHSDPTKHINDCLIQLEVIQECYLDANDAVAREWTHELTSEDDVSVFVDVRLLETRLTYRDFADGELNRLFGFAVGA